MLPDILQIVRALRPNTAWNMIGIWPDVIIIQAADNTPRVSVPTSDEITAYIQDNGL